MAENVTLWRPTGQAELDLVAESGWKKWPPRLPGQPIFYPVLNRPYATQIAREWNVPKSGVGYVTTFEVSSAFLDRYEVHKVGGREAIEYWIPAEDLDAFNASIVGAIMEIAEYRGPVSAGEFESAERAMERTFPKRLQDYLQQPSWLRRGWLSDECYLRLHPPDESAAIAAAWQPSTSRHPGIVIIGDDGAGEHLAVDARASNSPVMAVNNVSGGWHDAVEQAETLEKFFAQVEDGTFLFRL